MKLRKLATKKDIAVVVVNQATTRFNNDKTSCVIPALGECWSYVPAVKIMLKNQPNSIKKTASLTKSPTKPPGIVTYVISSAGIHDITSSEDIINKKAVILSYDHKKKNSQNVRLQQISSNFITSSQIVINKHGISSVPIQGYDNDVKFLKRPGSYCFADEKEFLDKKLKNNET